MIVGTIAGQLHFYFDVNIKIVIFFFLAILIGGSILEKSEQDEIIIYLFSLYTINAVSLSTSV